MNTIRKPRDNSALAVDETGFCTWLGQARPGESFAYHRGFLLLDSVRGASLFSERDRHELLRLRKRARWAEEQGLAHLIQKRNGPDDYSYLAVARPRPAGKHVTIAELLPVEAA